jgi:hypothetical protein
MALNRVLLAAVPVHVMAALVAGYTATVAAAKQTPAGSPERIVCQFNPFHLAEDCRLTEMKHEGTDVIGTVDWRLNCIDEQARFSANSSPMTTTVTTMLMAFLVTLSLLPASVVADDVAIKKRLVGSWKTPGGSIVLKENGVIIDPNNPGSKQRWDMNDDLGHHRDGVIHTFFEATAETGTTTGHNFFKIISLSETKLVIQDLYHGHNRGTWIRLSSKH